METGVIDPSDPDYGGQQVKVFTDWDDLYIASQNGVVGTGEVVGFNQTTHSYMEAGKEYAGLAPSSVQMVSRTSPTYRRLYSTGPNPYLGQLQIDGWTVDYAEGTATNPGTVQLFGIPIGALTWALILKVVAALIALLLITICIWRLTAWHTTTVECSGNICWATKPDGSSCTYDMTTGEVIDCSEPPTSDLDMIVYAVVAVVALVAVMMLFKK